MLQLFYVTPNKADKDYSPTTMYKDHSINESLFHELREAHSRPHEHYMETGPPHPGRHWKCHVLTPAIYTKEKPSTGNSAEIGQRVKKSQDKSTVFDSAAVQNLPGTIAVPIVSW